MNSIMTILEPIIQDAPSVPFPMKLIEKELVNLLIGQEEFQYFIEQSYKKLVPKFGIIIGSVFLEIMKREMKIDTDDIYKLEYGEYALRVTKMIEELEQIKIVTIPRNSPDYELVRELSKI